MSGLIRILIADDHPLFRAGLRSLLESVPDTEVVGEATTGPEAVELTRTVRPDVVVMDINMPDLNGIEATRQIVLETQDTHVLVMTMHEDDESVFAALRAGARGYQLKGAAQAETLRAIRSVANGEAILGPAIAIRLQRYLTAPPTTDPGDAFPQLTERAATQLAGAASRLLVGWWSDRAGSRLGPMRLVALAIGLAMGALATLAWIGTSAAVAALATAAIVTVTSNGLAFTAVAERAGPRWAGRALGVQNTFQNVIATLVATPLALLIGAAGGGASGYALAFGAVVVFPFVAATLIPVRGEAPSGRSISPSATASSRETDPRSGPAR